MDRKRRHDAKRKHEQPWRRWYWTSEWKAVRAAQLKRQPRCAMCGKRATVADHIEPARNVRNDRAKFMRGPFQSLCRGCHDTEKQRSEKLGYSTAIDASGYPVDARHPFNIDRG